MRCVLVSKSLDLRGYLGPQFMRAADRIEIISHPHEGPATDVRLAVAWHPPDDAFERYPNLQAVCSIGAGVDNILACPSLRPDVEVIRVVDPAQAQMMSGFVAWHVIGHQRRFAVYQAQQREERWQRLGLRRAQDVPVGIFGLWRNRPPGRCRSRFGWLSGFGVEPNRKAGAARRAQLSWRGRSRCHARPDRGSRE